MVKKVATKVSKVTKSKPNQQSKKPKGKVVKVAQVEDVDKTELENVKNAKTAKKNVKSVVDFKKLTKALSELKKFIEKSNEQESEKLQLFDDDSNRKIELVFVQKKLFTTKPNLKQKLIHITNKPQPETQPTIALFVRDNVITKELLEKIEESELNKLIGEIIPAAELKSTYKQYEKRRELLSKYDLFLSDDGLVPTLPKLLGKVFYSTSKAPIAVRVSSPFSIESALNQVNKVLNSVVYQLPRNNSLNVRLGSIDNLDEGVLEQVIAHFPVEDLTSIFIKSSNSPALPLYEVDTVYTEADIADGEAVESKPQTIEVDGDEIEIDEYEKGLIELAQPSQIKSILESKIKNSTKKSNSEKKDSNERKTLKTVAKTSDKVSKPSKKKSVKA